MAKRDIDQILGLRDNPDNWHETDFHRDHETRLPTRLYPFEICEVYTPRHEPTGKWELAHNTWDGRPSRSISKHEGIFAAYRAMIDAYEKWLPNRPQEQVYFIGSELRTGALVKIGYSTNPAARLRTLQTSNAEPLRIFATTFGDRDLEARYHRRWSARRRAGEWFILGDCIIDEIKRLQEAA